MSSLHEMAEALEQSRTCPEAGDKAAAYQVMAEISGVAAVREKLQGQGSDECESCGVEIPQARRRAAPWATCCIDCASLKEVRRG